MRVRVGALSRCGWAVVLHLLQVQLALHPIGWTTRWAGSLGILRKLFPLLCCVGGLQGTVTCQSRR